MGELHLVRRLDSLTRRSIDSASCPFWYVWVHFKGAFWPLNFSTSPVWLQPHVVKINLDPNTVPKKPQGPDHAVQVFNNIVSALSGGKKRGSARPNKAENGLARKVALKSR